MADLKQVKQVACAWRTGSALGTNDADMVWVNVEIG
jgi:hypothetical protein